MLEQESQYMGVCSQGRGGTLCIKLLSNPVQNNTFRAKLLNQIWETFCIFSWQKSKVKLFVRVWLKAKVIIFVLAFPTWIDWLDWTLKSDQIMTRSLSVAVQGCQKLISSPTLISIDICKITSWIKTIFERIQTTAMMDAAAVSTPVEGLSPKQSDQNHEIYISNMVNPIKIIKYIFQIWLS